MRRRLLTDLQGLDALYAAVRKHGFLLPSRVTPDLEDLLLEAWSRPDKRVDLFPSLKPLPQLDRS